MITLAETVTLMGGPKALVTRVSTLHQRAKTMAKTTRRRHANSSVRLPEKGQSIFQNEKRAIELKRHHKIFSVEYGTPNPCLGVPEKTLCDNAFPAKRFPKAHRHFPEEILQRPLPHDAGCQVGQKDNKTQESGTCRGQADNCAQRRRPNLAHKE